MTTVISTSTTSKASKKQVASPVVIGGATHLANIGLTGALFRQSEEVTVSNVPIQSTDCGAGLIRLIV